MNPSAFPLFILKLILIDYKIAYTNSWYEDAVLARAAAKLQQ